VVSRSRFISGAGSAIASIAATPARAGTLPPGTVLASSPDYDAARRNENARLDRHPRAIVFCSSTDDVVRAIRWANGLGAPLAIRSGRHDYEGFSLNDGGVVIDVGRHQGIGLVDGGSQAWIAAGTDVGTMYRRLGAFGRTLPGGTCHSVALAGLTTGGGFGLIGRRHGLLADRLQRVRLVDAAGHLRDSARDPDGEDIMWACRGGGGGNFGVVTDMLFSLVAAPDHVVVFSLAWDLRHATEVLQRWMAWAPHQSRDLVAICLVQNQPAPRVRVIGQYLGSEATLRHRIERAFVRADATDFSIESMSYAAAAEYYGGYGLPRLSWKMKSSFGARPLGTVAIAAAAALVESAPDDVRCIIQFDSLGGAVNDVAPTATAFPHRDMTFLLQYRTYWSKPSAATRAFAWARRAFATLDPYTAARSYRNYCDLDLTEWRQRYHAFNYARLQHVKARLDPFDRFTFAQGIELPGSVSAAPGARSAAVTSGRNSSPR
jgi:FAD/FMN-containing dehydrogenase